MADDLLNVIDLHVSVDENEILHGVNLSIHPGETHVIMGPNGAGKSTFGNALMGSPNYTVTEGSAFFGGEDLFAKSVSERAKSGLFMSFQNPVEVPGISLENFMRTALEQRDGKKLRLWDFRKEIMKALDVLHTKSSENPRQPMRALRYRPGCAFELLGRCKYFQVERLLLNTSDNCRQEFSTSNAVEQSVDCSTDALSFRVLLCLEGAGKLLTEIDSGSFEILPFQKGDCMFLPADSPRLTLSGNAQLLRVSC